MEIEQQPVQKLRQLFSAYQIDAYIVPHNDAHESEYLADADERLAYVSGFTGSNGFAFVSNTEALLWTDSRYYIQAERQLKQPWEMRKMEAGVPSWFQHVLNVYQPGFKVGFDPMLRNHFVLAGIHDQFRQKQIDLVPVDENLVDKIWENKPSEPLQKIFVHDEKWHNAPFSKKYEQIREYVQSSGAGFVLTQLLDEIAWTLNLRGSDITYNPVFKSYLLLDYRAGSESRGTLYIRQDKLDEGVRQYLQGIQIATREYNDVFIDLAALRPASDGAPSNKVAVNKESINCRLFNSIDASLVVHPQPHAAPITFLKALKNTRETEGFRQSHIRDGAALVSYFAWLEDELLNKNNRDLDELSASLVLDEKRTKGDYSYGPSFATISSIGANAAVVHYHATKESAAKLNPDLIYLCDSGGQYSDGTTDVTRTLHFSGKATQEEKDAYTRVLLGNLDIQRLIWPKKSKITGSDIDVLARRHLWQAKLDYGHGTGHGVGYFLCVHEGPQGISKYRNQILFEGMVVTDEPGYYKAGAYGIRIEDLLLVESKDAEHLGFQNLTQCPYDRNLIDVSLLSKSDIAYLNEYHQKVYNNLAPILEQRGDQLALDWLKRHTAPLWDAKL